MKYYSFVCTSRFSLLKFHWRFCICALRVLLYSFLIMFFIFVTRVMLNLCYPLVSVPPFSVLQKNLFLKCFPQIIFSLNVWQNLPVKSSGIFFVGTFLHLNFNSWNEQMVIQSISLWVTCVNFFFSRNLFISSNWIYWHKVVYNIFALYFQGL